MSLATIQQLRRGLQEWAQREGHRKFLHDSQVAQLEAVLGDPTRRAQAHVASWMLGTWHLGHGMLRIADGDVEGFDEARIGQALRRASLLARARHRAGSRRGASARLPFSLLHGAWTCLLGLALRDPGAEPLFAWLQGLPDIAFRETDELPYFVRELLTLRAGRRPTLSSRLGPFEPVLLHWTGDERVLARDLADLCDWQLTEARRPGGALDDPACRLYPLLAFAVRDVRDWLELPMPKVDHPLVATNLGQMRPRTPWPSDEFVRRMENLT